MSMKVVRPILIVAGVAALVLMLQPSLSGAEDAGCVACHEDLTAGASVHAAVSMGCTSCHGGVDPADVPHKFTTRNPKGLSSKLRDICYDCHERKTFAKKTVHGALLLGCTTCHNPHRSDHDRLLKEEITPQCMGCHQDRFTPGKAGSHVLAGNEACAGCHDPHASDQKKLLIETKPAAPAPKPASAQKKSPASR